MHRSGTSAVTGALGHLGLQMPSDEDRPAASESNPDHWESLALGVFNDALLRRLDSTWDGPPSLPLGDVQQLDAVGDPTDAVRTAFPHEGPLAWKDPRTTLLLPYWRQRLPGPLAAVFIWRSPVPVARSLQVRDGMHLLDGIALWERYNRAGIYGLEGIDTYVTGYESILEDPLGRLGDIATWLSSLDQFADYAKSWDLPAAADSIVPVLRHHPPSDEESLLLESQRNLASFLTAIDGPHRPLDQAPPGDESAWSTAILEDRRRHTVVLADQAAVARELSTFRAEAAASAQEAAAAMAGLQRDLEAARSALQTRTDELEATDASLRDLLHLVENMEASTSWRITRPIRSLGGLRGQPPA